MKRFLATTAIVMSMSGAAMADSHAAKPMTGNGEIGSAVFNQTDFLASNLIGMRIYNVEADMDTSARVMDGAETEWDDIGEINDIIVTADGQISAVILGVGGFLGIGERDVAVAMDAITVVQEDGDSDDRFLVVKTSKEQLEQLPEFDRELNAVMEDAEKAADGAATAAASTAKEAEMAADRAMLKRPNVAREGYAETDYSVLTADKLEGARLYGVEDEDVGEVETLIVDDSGKITHVLADIGGFLGMGEHTVKLAFEELQIINNADATDFRIYVDSTEEQLEKLPEHAE